MKLYSIYYETPDFDEGTEIVAWDNYPSKEQALKYLVRNNLISEEDIENTLIVTDILMTSISDLDDNAVITTAEYPLLEDNKVTAMIEINSKTAEAIWGEYDTTEVYILHDDGSESLVEWEDHEDFDHSLRYGIEGIIFGKPYGKKGA